MMATISHSQERDPDGNVPPLFRGLPLLGLLPELRRDPLPVFMQARNLGEVVQLHIPGRHPIFVLSNPIHIRQVLQEDHGNYRRSPFHDRLRPILGQGLVTSDGQLWERQRRLLQPSLGAERIRSFISIMGALSADRVERWEAQSGTVLDVSQQMSDLTVSIVVRCMFGQEPRADDAAISAAVAIAQDYIADRFWSLAPNWTERLPTPANRRFAQALATLNSTVDAIISRRIRREEGGDDLLGKLLSALRTDPDTMTVRQVRDEVITMLIAGHETSATALTWTWYLLGIHPHVSEAVFRESACVLHGRAAPEADDLPNLVHTRAVIQESMRLFPPVPWFGRLAAGPTRVGPCSVPGGAILALSHYLVQRDPQFWPEPEQFQPERFAPGTRHLPYTYFPFGGGPRTCIGNHFATTELVVALAALISKVHLTPAFEGVPRPELLVTLRPAHGLPMRIERRGQSRHSDLDPERRNQP